MNVDNDASLQLTDGEIMDMIMNPEHNKQKDIVDEDFNLVTERIISVDKCIEVEVLLAGLEQRSFMCEQEVVQGCSIRKKLKKERPGNIKQTTLHGTFRKSNSYSYKEQCPAPFNQ